jgi:hypothetical protein
MRSKNRPLLFVTDVLGATPEPWQAAALKAVGQHDRVSIRSGHGVGKTTLQAWLVLWFLLTRKNCKVPVAANSQDQLRDTIWPEIAKWHRQLPDALRTMIDVQAERIVVVQDPEGAFAVRRTASKENPEALQGFHAEHLLFLIDEASGIPDVVFEVGMGALSTPGAKVLMAGNPTRASASSMTRTILLGAVGTRCMSAVSMSREHRGTSTTYAPSMGRDQMRGGCACSVSSRRQKTRRSSLWSLCCQRWGEMCRPLTTIQSGAWMWRVLVMTEQLSRSDRPTGCLSLSDGGAVPT